MRREKTKGPCNTAPASCDSVSVKKGEEGPVYGREDRPLNEERRGEARGKCDRQMKKGSGQDENEALMAFHQADSQESDVNILEGDSNTFSIIHRPTRRHY